MSKIILFNGGPVSNREINNQSSAGVIVETYKTSELAVFVDISITILNKNTPIDFTDAYAFTRYHTLDSLNTGIIHTYLKKIGVPFAHPVILNHPGANEKTAQMPLLAQNDIPVPKSIILSTAAYYENKEYIHSNFSFPLVMKFDGSRGDQVFVVQNENEIEAQLPEGNYTRFTLQEIIQSDFDVRVLVAYGEVLGAIKRQSDSFYNNISKGATAEKYSLTHEEESLAKKACSVAGLDFAGVDLMHKDTHAVCLEVNSGPQIIGFESVYGKGYVFKKLTPLIEVNFK